MSHAAALAARLRRLASEPGFGRRLLIVELTIGAMLLARGIELAKDSSGYLDGAVFRSPLYPLLLDALELAFGRYALGALLVVHLTLGLVAAAALILYLRRALALPEWLAWLAVLLVLALPYLGPHAVASRVLSEGVAYPLFLLVMRSLLGAMLERRLDCFTAAAVWSAALILCRPQFVFLWPLLALCALFWLIDGGSKRRVVTAVGLVAVVAASTWLADSSYRLIRHGRFAGAPFAGLQLVAGALYVAPGSVVDKLPPGQRELYAALHGAARQRELLASANPSPGGISSYAWHYRQNYNAVVWDLIMPELRQRTGLKAGGEDWFAIEDQLLPLALSLIRAEPLGFARLYLSNILSSLSFPYAILLVVITPLALGRGLMHGGSADLAAGLVALTHLANGALVAVVEPLKLRYSFYTDGLVVVLLVALVVRTARPLRPEAGLGG